MVAEDNGLQALSTQMATANARLENLQRGVDALTATLKDLTEGHSASRAFEAETRRRLDDCEEDRRDLWSQLNKAKEAAARAEARSDSAHLWLKVACGGYGAALLAIAVKLFGK
jgi:chromosome segregation ATPase